MRFFDLLDDRIVFFAARLVYAIVEIGAAPRLIRRNHVDVEFVNVVKLCGFSLGRTSHARQLLVKPEIILNWDGRQGLGLAIDLDALLRFDSLMQSITPTSPRHLAARELIDNHHLVIFYDVVENT